MFQRKNYNLNLKRSKSSKLITIIVYKGGAVVIYFLTVNKRFEFYIDITLPIKILLLNF